MEDMKGEFQLIIMLGMSLLLYLFCDVLRNQTSGLVYNLTGLESGENYTFTLVWSTEGECDERKDGCKFKKFESQMIHTQIGKPDTPTLNQPQDSNIRQEGFTVIEKL